MTVKAKLRYLHLAPKKVRLVVDLIRGLSVIEATEQLQFLRKRAAKPTLKLLNSAIANAENNFKLLKDNLYIREIFVDEGPKLKRWRPRAFGRASPIYKRSSHITLILDELVKKGKEALAPRQIKKAPKVEKKIVSYREVKHESRLKKKLKAGKPDQAQPSQIISGSKGASDRVTIRQGEE